jgi:CHAT domain-containing protein
LIGLTRAFQYAGARSVVASSWSVADQVTAELMVRFHRHLAAGLAKDQALRAAQIELIRRPIRISTADGRTLETDASAPFFWAAFQLFGDWR